MKMQHGLGKLITACFLLICTFRGTAQEPYEPGKVIPPSPTAASLGVYGDLKLGYYSGTPDITVPLYTIKTGHHSVPIFMKYNASGFRVSEMAGWVGLGWSLNAGGVITKTVRGLDDFGNGGYYSASALPPVNGGVPNATDVAYFRSVMRGQIDGDPDIYAYNFGEYSGKFVMGKATDGAPVFISDKNNLQITYTQNTSTWTVKTPDGYSYNFSREERQKNYYFSATYPNAIPMNSPISTFHWDGKVDAITGWNLTQIIAPNGEIITFNYQVKSFTIGLTNRSETEYNMTRTLGGCQNQASFPATVKQFTFSKQEIADQYLTTITFDNGSVEFITTDRDDLEYMPTATTGKPQKLSAIIIKDKAGNQFKKFQFDYGYFTGNSTRLQLNSITELGKNNEANCPYVFSYYNPGGLPPLYTDAIDHWGFYNGQGNAGLLPPGEQDNLSFPGARRVPNGDLEQMKAAVLSDITYPTGGSTNFEYEMNEYRNLTGEDRFDRVFERFDAYAWDNDPMSHSVIQFDLAVATDVEFAWGYQDIDGIEGGRMVGVQVVFGILEQQGVGRIANFDNWDVNTNHETGGATQRRTKFLQPGHYVVSVTNIQGYWTEVAASYNLKVPVAFRKGGGLRVKTITNYDKGEKVSVKKYRYVTNDVNNETSGKLICQPKYLYTTGLASVGSNGCNAIFMYLGRVSNSMMPPYLAAGGPLIGYDRVIETIGDNGEGGRNEYYFHNDEEAVSGDATPLVSGYLNPTNGRLATAIVKDAAGNVVSIKESAYSVKSTTALRGVKAFQPNAIDPSMIDNASFELKFYSDYSNWTVTSTDKETQRKTGSPDLVNSTQYFYDNADHLQVTRKEFTGSNGKTQITRYRYPADYTSAPATSFVAGMKGTNQVATVIEQQTTVKTGQTEKLTAGVFTEYIQTNNYYQPYKVYKVETREPSLTTSPSDITAGGQISLNPLFKEAVTFDQYDAAGNLNTYHKSGDAYQTYIWDRTISRPIAQAANTNLDQVAYTSFETIETGNWAYTGGSLASDAISGKLSLLLSGMTISKTGLQTATTYVVSYWSKGGQVLVNGVPGTAGMTKKGWTYYENTVSNATGITITGSGLLDELRLHPVGVPMKTYTYDPFLGVTTEGDQNNRMTYYEYDGLARLLRIRDAENNILKQFSYQCQDLSNVPNWQPTGITRCKPCEGTSYTTNIKQIEEKDMNPLHGGVTRWTEIGASSDCVLQPDWQNTTTPLRCRVVNGNTGEREQEQKDINPCSNQGVRWVVVDFNCASCPTPPNWQETGNTRCEVDANGGNTGYIETESRDISPCGNNQTIWTNGGNYQPYVCTPPCFYCDIEGIPNRCIRGTCEQGYKVYTDSEWNGSYWICTYHYEWSDGSWSEDFEESGSWHCN